MDVPSFAEGGTSVSAAGSSASTSSATAVDGWSFASSFCGGAFSADFGTSSLSPSSTSSCCCGYNIENQKRRNIDHEVYKL